MPTGSPSLEQDARKFAVSLERYRYVVLALFTLLYALGVVRHAANRPLWYDEIITVISASAPDAATTWKAAQATDASPPLLHLLTHFSMQWFGSSEVAIRLPAMAGFWVFCLCLFHFVRRRAGIYFAFAALLMPIATEAYSYAFDARAYGMVLGLCGLMLVGWQMANDGRSRVLGCVLLAFSMAAALLLQYYAILLYGPLAGAELYRTRRERRWNWGVWAAFAAGVAPLVWRMATIRNVVSQFSQTTWSPAYPEQIVEYWETMLQHSASFVVAGIAVMALSLLSRPADEDTEMPPELLAHEVLAAVLFLAIPVMAVGIGIFKTHMFTPRYALIGLTGILLLVPFITARLSNGRALAGFLLLSVSILPALFVALEAPPRENPVEREATLIKALEQGPVAIPDGQLYMQMWYYTPEPLKSRLLFLVDYQAAIQYMGFDAFYVGVISLRPWSSVTAVSYKDFATPGREFRLYQNSLRPGWVLAKVVKDGAATQIEQNATIRQLIRVRLKP